MSVKQFLGAVIAMVIRIVVAAAVIIVVFRLSVQAYDFGFRIFAEPPVSEGNGRTVSVVVLEGNDAMDIGKILEEKGLIKDAKLFYVQERLSNYHNLIQPGVYELSTAMTIEEMINIMGGGETPVGETE